ncbi:MAG: 8-amino-7-oxononanoate synthase [Deltaproteobacteria bacterium]|nr:8-amino-7-oxononanoate synthase [Deltaproteobacteria bacterium]
MHLDDAIDQTLARIDRAGLRRTLLSLDSPPGPRVVVDGRELVNLCGNDYLGLAGDAGIIQAGIEAAQKFGAGSGASRLVTGSPSCHGELEDALARFFGTEAALLCGSGYHANTGLIPALAGKNDVVFSDELNHASIIDGCRLSKAERHTYRHADITHLEQLLTEHRDGKDLAFVVTESVFSMDGDTPDLAAIADLCERHDAALIVDEAHAVGVLGAGRGAMAALGLTGRAAAVVGTFGKAFGSFGAFVATSAKIRELLINRSRSVIFSTALPPFAVGAAHEALRRIEAQGAAFETRLHEVAHELAQAAREAGLSVLEPAAAVVPAIVGGEAEALAVAEKLLDAGILARAIRPPTVPPGSCRLRLTACVTHSPEDLARVHEAFGAIGRGSGAEPPD